MNISFSTNTIRQNRVNLVNQNSSYRNNHVMPPLNHDTFERIQTNSIAFGSNSKADNEVKTLFPGLFPLQTDKLKNQPRISPSDKDEVIDANTALQKLMDGNKRFVANNVKHPDQNIERRAELTKGQHPFAVILGCSDSRISPEILFDQGLGDLFVVRVAGNTLSDDVLGSLEYGVEHLGAPLVVVLGHEKCGAVTAAVKGSDTGNSHIGCLVDAIKPAVQMSQGQKGDLVDIATHNNVKLVVQKIKASEPLMAESIKEGKVKVVGAYYDLDTGKVVITE